MTGRARPVEHVVAGGYCQQCGELESWLVEQGATIAPACGELLLAGHSTALDCVRPAGHVGDHRSYGGSSWAY